MSDLFKTLEIEAFRAGIKPRTDESREWFRKKAQQIRGISRQKLMKNDSLDTVNESIVGSMMMFFYDPKTKDTLPYYDNFPLVIVVGPAEKGFYGLNLHYLPPKLRALFLDALLDIMNNKRYDKSTKFNLSYGLLMKVRRMKYFAPCFKHYLTAHVKGNFAKVNAPEYEIAIFLPTASWSKASASTVYAESRKIIRDF